MKTKRILACLLASIMACGAFTACGDKEEESSSASESSVSESSEESSDESSEESSPAEDSSSEAEESSTPVAVETPEFEEAVVAESGDAYLAIVDSQWWIQYWGTNEHPLTYDAGLAPITGNGDYTVSVTADTNGFRFDTTGDANDQYVPSGLSFAAVIVQDGDTLFPNMTIDITSIRIDGTEVPMIAEDFTCVDAGMRSNIYNEWVPDDSLPADAHDANGPVTSGTGYSAQIVDPAAFADGWTTVEVDFTVSGVE